jgi:hypothetical protein
MIAAPMSASARGMSSREKVIKLRRRKRMHRAALAVVAFAGPWVMQAAAQQAIPLPTLSACVPTTASTLPVRWRAVGLMIPFTRQQLDVGEFVYDGALPGMRATLYGLESGTLDLLITETQTYQLLGPYRSTDGCIAVGRKYRPPANRWLSGNAVCVGEAALATTPAQWWKMPAADGRAKWLWYKTETQLPWRIMFPSQSRDPAVIGDYAMTYFPTFAPLAETNLAGLRDFCVSQTRKRGSSAAAAAKSGRAIVAVRNESAEAERLERIQALIPGLSNQACARMTLARWPDQFVMTATISPIRFSWEPYPSVIYYDWEQTATMVSVLHKPGAVPAIAELTGMLTKGTGYTVRQRPTGALQCTADNPGIVRPDWMTAAGCRCKAVVDHNPDLGPNDVGQILACPIDKSNEDHVHWAWYTTEGRPILFMEPAAIGNGVNIADYQLWLPGQKASAGIFELPKVCVNSAHKGLPPSATINCSDCHTTRQ